MFKEYFNHASQLIYIVSTKGQIIEVNDAVIELTGIEKDKLINEAFWEIPCWIHSKHMQNMILFSIEKSAMTMHETRFAAQFQANNGDIIDLDFILKPIIDEKANIKYFIGMGYNITSLIDAHKSLSDYERQLTSLFKNSNDGFIFNMLEQTINLELCSNAELEKLIIEKHKIMRWNKSFKKIFAYTKTQINENRDFRQLLKIDKTKYKKIINELIARHKCSFEHSFENQKNKDKTCKITLSFIVNENLYYGFSCVVTDITTSKVYEQQLIKYATTDFLTKLNNRRKFFSLASNKISKSQAISLCMCDIDKFKQVNDQYGHDTGDIVLKNFAKLFKKFFNKYAITARFGGEEFALLFYEIDFAYSLRLLNDFRIALQQFPHRSIENDKIYVTVSIGVKQIKEQDTNIDTILNQADIALYNAKETGRNRIVLYNENRMSS